jgi:hypothetical protein
MAAVKSHRSRRTNARAASLIAVSAAYYSDIPRLQAPLRRLELEISSGAPAWLLSELRDARDCTVNLLARARLAQGVRS